MKTKLLFSWSGGKDSALALYEIRKSQDFEIAALLTTITQEHDRICMHGVRSNLLTQQGKSLDVPVEKIYLTKNSPAEEYGDKMAQVLAAYRTRGVEAVAFGDIFLEDVRAYRQENLSKVGMKAIFPLWGRDSGKLARAFIDLGFKAIITSADSRLFDKSSVGRRFDTEFLRVLPASVDPCGENGEFHTFVYDGPIFREPIALKTGRVILGENRFYYCDLTLIED